MKKWLKKNIIKFVNAPQAGIYSSQTLYEALFFTLELGRIKGLEYAYPASMELAERIVASQLPDGGFDIGYDFIFGNGLRKTHDKEGTTPECLSITALAFYLEAYGEVVPTETRDSIEKCIEKGVVWIIKHAIEVSQTEKAIPYAPLTYKKVHITNATSFAISALSSAVQFLKPEIACKVTEILPSLIFFMRNQLDSSVSGGMYWPYFYRHGNTEEKKLINDKIDNYHIAQQLYHHCVSLNYFECPESRFIVSQVSEYLLSQVDEDGFVPYTIKQGVASDKVDLWGYASLIMGFSSAYAFTQDRRLLGAIDLIADYLRKYCCAKDYFYPIVSSNNKLPFDANYYPRSDAWVIHSVAAGAKISNACMELIPFCELVFSKMRDSGYIGKENHTLTIRKLVFSRLVSLVKS